VPTTPNPTPPTAEPGTGEDIPAPPVYDTTKPAITGQYIEASKSSISYADHNYDATTLRSPYYDLPSIVSVPGTVMLDGVCPGRWSRGYEEANSAASLSGGSGYFGYQNLRWWSTNFIDDGDAACTMVLNEGQYYSKNSSISDNSILCGAVTVEGSTVKLKWGSSWGLVTRNTVFDSAAENGSYPYRQTTIPRLTDGKVDVTALNLSVMKYAPLRGCLVMLNLATNIVLYTMMDGEYRQMAAMYGPVLGAPATGPPATAPALQSRDATDPSSLPLSSKLTGLPTMTDGTVTLTNTTAPWVLDKTTQPPRTSPWLGWFEMWWFNEGPVDVSSTSTLPPMQANTAVFAAGGLSNGSFYGFSSNGRIRKIVSSEPNSVLYSGWARTGTPHQRVGYVGYGNTLALSTWGWTSVAPDAALYGQSHYVLTSANVQTEILGQIPNHPSVNMGFVYDAAYGNYGRVRWISQF